MVMNDSFRQKVCALLKKIPEGRVATYGQIAVWVGTPKGARGVAWILHSCSRSHRLPWHRVVNRMGGISLRPGRGYELQKELLLMEGVRFDERGCIDLDLFGWQPGRFHP